LHEDPDVPSYGKQGSGPVLREGMVIAVEPMLNLGTPNIYILDDDWTIITADDKPSAHFEHTVLVTKDGYEILTKR
jgi:methionyl aminopeptidase